MKRSGFPPIVPEHKDCSTERLHEGKYETEPGQRWTLNIEKLSPKSKVRDHRDVEADSLLIGLWHSKKKALGPFPACQPQETAPILGVMWKCYWHWVMDFKTHSVRSAGHHQLIPSPLFVLFWLGGVINSQ